MMYKQACTVIKVLNSDTIKFTELSILRFSSFLLLHTYIVVKLHWLCNRHNFQNLYILIVHKQGI